MAQLDDSWRPDLSNIYINVMPKLPDDLRDQLPAGPQSFVFGISGQLSAEHLTQLITIVIALVQSDVPAILRAAAPAGYLRQGVPLNPLLKPYIEKDGAAIAEAFIQILCASADLPIMSATIA